MKRVILSSEYQKKNLIFRGDSYSDTGWYFDIHGNRDTECQLWTLEDEVSDLLGCGAEIRVDDKSYIDFSKYS